MQNPLNDPEPDYDAEMRLPEGSACNDCVHAKRCFGLGFSKPGNTSCDFWPSRFRNARLDQSADDVGDAAQVEGQAPGTNSSLVYRGKGK